MQHLKTKLTSLLIISARKQHENEISYHPFRMTPYLIKVQDPENTDDQLCCVLLAEKVHSGYEGNNLVTDFSLRRERLRILQ